MKQTQFGNIANRIKNGVDQDETKSIADALEKGFVKSKNGFYSLFKGKDVTIKTVIRCCVYLGFRLDVLDKEEQKLIDRSRGGEV